MAKGKSGAKGGVAALERSPSHLLHRALQIALDIFAEERGADPLTQRQFAVLAAAADREGATQTDLVRITGIDRSTLADMVARMIAKGLLARERSTLDARANAVRLTEAGLAALDRVRPKVETADARILKLISGGKRRDAFLECLRDLAAGEDPSKADGEGKGGKKKRKKAKAAALANAPT